MATHSSILAWRIPWTEEPGGLQSIAYHRVGHLSNLACLNIYRHIYIYIYIYIIFIYLEGEGSLIAQLVKNPPEMQGTPVWFLGGDDLLEKR